MAENSINSHKDLTVWRKAMTLAERIYEIADEMPKKEEYRMTSQLVRAAISIPANIAEGNARGTKKDYAHFISIARGSAAEVDTLLDLSARAGFASKEKIDSAAALADEISRMLNSMRQRLTTHP